MVLCFVFLASTGADGIDDPEGLRGEIYRRVIDPWIEQWFLEHAVEVDLTEGIKIRRKLIEKELSGFEVVDGRDHYTVNILYMVSITDRPLGLDVWGLKEQRIVFWVEGMRIRDYYPGEEHWVRVPHWRNGSGKFYI